jgi:hypothetical protein
MKTSTIIPTTLLAALALSLAACNTTPTPSVMSKDDAKNLKTIMPLAMNGLANSIRQGGSSVVASGIQAGPAIAAMWNSPLAAQAARSSSLEPQAISGNCGPSTTPTDADGDKVPANFNYTYNCTVVFSPSFTFKASGAVSSVDANDNDATSGFTTSGEILYQFIFTNTTTSEVSSFNFIAKWSGAATIGVSGAYSISTDQRVIFQPDTTKNEFSYTMTASYAPDNDGNTQKFDAGTINFDGQVAYTDANKKLSRFKLASSDLHFGGSCTRGVDRGTVRSEDESNIGGTKNNVFELKATACDTWTATYNSEILF